MNQNGPLVSCIMPTRNRGKYLEGAVRSFAAQTYQNRELVILEDGDRAEGLPLLAQWVKAGLQVNYRFLGGRRTIGAKRNACIGLARGSIVAHWDDDDRSGPNRLETQVSTLLARPECLGTAFNSVLFWHEGNREAFRYRSPKKLSGVGTSFVYHRKAAIGHPFADKNAGEDVNFLLEVGGAFHFEPDEGRIVARIHDFNTSRKQINHECFERITLNELPDWFDADAT